MGIKRRTNAALAVTMKLTLAACGGGYNSGPAPSSPGAGSSAATITITAAGVSPNAVTISVGARVTFQNNDNRPHEPASDPHPSHGSCPPLDQIGTIQAGQSRTSGNFNTPGVCRYHDHLFDTNAAYNGTITVQ